ncbi:hypothetical protein NC652_004889 [Populus alba x Populus x berolinensis]|nr:hypothetical protein NC652_004889 [Populus alba x Populus x berolinensis]
MARRTECRTFLRFIGRDKPLGFGYEHHGSAAPIECEELDAAVIEGSENLWRKWWSTDEQDLPGSPTTSSSTIVPEMQIFSVRLTSGRNVSQQLVCRNFKVLKHETITEIIEDALISLKDDARSTKHDNVNDLSGEITSECPAASPSNSIKESSPVLIQECNFTSPKNTNPKAAEELRILAKHNDMENRIIIGQTGAI